MTLTFKTKDNPSIIDNDTSKLAKFLIDNTKYLEITFASLSRRKKPTNIIERYINASPEIDTVNNDAKFNDYINLMKLFYSSSQEELNDRRGFLLELIIRKLKPLIDTTYVVISESIVFHNKIQISNFDIDVVLQYKDLELIECKANIENYLYEPLRYKPRMKLSFMENVNQISIIEGISSHLFFATYGTEELKPLEVLKNNGFNNFKILTRDEIIKRI